MIAYQRQLSANDVDCASNMNFIAFMLCFHFPHGNRAH